LAKGQIIHRKNQGKEEQQGTSSGVRTAKHNGVWKQQRAMKEGLKSNEQQLKLSRNQNQHQEISRFEYGR